MSLGTFDRTDNIARLGGGTFDVLVVGGGITGAGVALDAASRGLRVALVERDDFASGTSSKSSKLVHGGLRYLQQRRRPARLRGPPRAPAPPPQRPPPGQGAAVPHPDLHGEGRCHPQAGRPGPRLGHVDVRPHRRPAHRPGSTSASSATRRWPTCRRSTDRLAWAYLYYDAQADDARLTLTVARTAALDHGATVVNHAAVVELAKDAAGGSPAPSSTPAAGRSRCAARAVVNATGVWSDDVRALDEGTHPDTIRPAKGVHITVPWDMVRNDIAAVVPVPRDRRSIFVVPWPGRRHVGGPGLHLHRHHRHRLRRRRRRPAVHARRTSTTCSRP